jgi:hypothetical protein
MPLEPCLHVVVRHEKTKGVKKRNAPFPFFIRAWCYQNLIRVLTRNVPIRYKIGFAPYYIVAVRQPAVVAPFPPNQAASCFCYLLPAILVSSIFHR